MFSTSLRVLSQPLSKLGTALFCGKFPTSSLVRFLVTLRAKLSGAVYCNRPCLCVCVFVGLCVCLFVGLLPR